MADPSKELDLTLHPGLLAVLVFCGLVGNVLVVQVCRKRRNKSGMEVFIITIALSDIANLLFAGVMSKLPSLNNTFTRSVFLCPIAITLVASPALVSQTVAIFTAVDRYLAVVRPYKKLVTYKRAVWAVVLTVIASVLLINVPYATAVIKMKHCNSTAKCINCRPVVGFRFYAYTGLCFASTCAVMTSAVYTALYFKLRRQKRVLPVATLSYRISQRNNRQGQGAFQGAREENGAGGMSRPACNDDFRNPLPSHRGNGLYTFLSRRSSISSIILEQCKTNPRASRNISIRAQPANLRDQAVTLDPTILQRNGGSGGMQPVRVPMRRRPELQRAVKIMIAISASIFIFWYPAVILDCLPSDVVIAAYSTGKAAKVALSITSNSVIIGSVFDPFIYNLINMRFRKECGKELIRWFHCTR